MSTPQEHNPATMINTDNLPWLDGMWTQLAASLAQERLPHAIMLTGPAGIGKSILAQRVVNQLLCLDPGVQACGNCRSCRLMAGGAHPDRFILEPDEDKQVIRVEQVRALIERLVLTTTISPRKVALVQPAEAMSGGAANALLKTLEEPPGETVLILVSNDPSRLPVTIRSRCQLWPLTLPLPDVATTWLETGQGVSRHDAELALEATSGSPLHAALLVSDGMLDQFSALRDNLEAMIGKPSRSAGAGAILTGLDPVLGWRWLSLAASAALRKSLGASTTNWPETDYGLPPAKIARLQRKADWALSQLGRGLRQDLLLQEWLLEWARLPSSEPIR